MRGIDALAIPYLALTQSKSGSADLEWAPASVPTSPTVPSFGLMNAALLLFSVPSRQAAIENRNQWYFPSCLWSSQELFSVLFFFFSSFCVTFPLRESKHELKRDGLSRRAHFLLALGLH